MQHRAANDLLVIFFLQRARGFVSGSVSNGLSEGETRRLSNSFEI